MPGILCAIRGGPSSQPTIEASIRLAKETHQTIYFLYVVNLDFLTHTSSSKTNQISQEIAEMGEFILLSTLEQATDEGVKAESIIREGNVMDEIIACCEEFKPSFVILGRPLEDQEDNLLTMERLQAFAEKIEEACLADVIYTPE
jgi:nucleotide-binding universal stress UspA family protein